MEMSDQPPASIAEDSIKDLLQLHRDRPATARHRFRAMSRFLDFLQDQKVIQFNPAQSVSKKRRPKPPAPRSTFYDAEVLNKLWNPEQPLKDVYLRYLRFLITTPLRAKEAAELTVGQISLSHMNISLSAADTKNKEEKNTNSRDFVFLMLAEVISRTFKINFSRANDTKGNETFTALDDIAEACQKIENFQDALQFSNLSKLRTQNQNIAYLVDNMLKKYGYYTKRAFKNTQ